MCSSLTTILMTEFSEPTQFLSISRCPSFHSPIGRSILIAPAQTPSHSLYPFAERLSPAQGVKEEPWCVSSLQIPVEESGLCEVTRAKESLDDGAIRYGKGMMDLDSRSVQETQAVVPVSFQFLLSVFRPEMLLARPEMRRCPSLGTQGAHLERLTLVLQPSRSFRKSPSIFVQLLLLIAQTLVFFITISRFILDDPAHPVG